MSFFGTIIRGVGGTAACFALRTSRCGFFHDPRFAFPVSCVMLSVSCFAFSVTWFVFLRVCVFTLRASRFVFRVSFVTFPVLCFGSHAPCFPLRVSRFPSSAPASLLRVWHCVYHARDWEWRNSKQNLESADPQVRRVGSPAELSRRKQ